MRNDSTGAPVIYYGDEIGTPGSVMTTFPFGRMPRGARGVGEVGVTEFAVPKGALDFWADRFGAAGVTGLGRETAFGENRLTFDGPDGDSFALVEAEDHGRTAWTGNGVSEDAGVLGFHGARFTLRDAAAALNKSKMLRAAFGDGVVDHYVRAARWEQEEYDRRVTDWEVTRGFERA